MGHDALHPFGAGGAYMNFMVEEREGRIRCCWIMRHSGNGSGSMNRGGEQ